jgi:hypothetical protein
LEFHPHNGLESPHTTVTITNTGIAGLDLVALPSLPPMSAATAESNTALGITSGTTAFREGDDFRGPTHLPALCPASTKAKTLAGAVCLSQERNECNLMALQRSKNLGGCTDREQNSASCRERPWGSYTHGFSDHGLLRQNRIHFVKGKLLTIVDRAFTISELT